VLFGSVDPSVGDALAQMLAASRTPTGRLSHMRAAAPYAIFLENAGRPNDAEAVMREVLPLGVAMVNDVRSLREPGALDAVAASDAAVCLMHMRGSPRTMQDHPVYADVVVEVGGFLRERALAAEASGVARERIVIDPGFGFGKTAAHNLTLWRQLGALRSLGWPILAGLSRKSLLGTITGRSVDQRVHASVAAALLAVQRGADIVRVHDVAATRDALAVLRAVDHEESFQS